MENEQTLHREIKSFVLRQGKITLRATTGN